jgi:hypothetical protein
MSRTGRLHQLHGVVRRHRGLSLGHRRSPDPLLDDPAAAPALPVPGGVRHPRVELRDLHGCLEDLQAEAPLDTPDPIEEPLVGHRHHRREGRDLLTQRQFCALRRGRQGDDGVTVTSRNRRNAQNCHRTDFYTFRNLETDQVNKKANFLAL